MTAHNKSNKVYERETDNTDWQAAKLRELCKHGGQAVTRCVWSIYMYITRKTETALFANKYKYCS